MTVHSTLYRLAATTALALAGLTGCDARASNPVSAVDKEAAPQMTEVAVAPDNPEVKTWLAGLQAATSSFHDIELAGRAGWNARITGCMEMPGLGGMGYHYANTALIDGVPQEFAPELLVYAPQKNGRLKFVAVEYIVPFSFVPSTAQPPSLHGIPFHQNFGFGLWVLHAWIGQHNPAGTFADWNPDVSCAFARF